MAPSGSIKGTHTYIHTHTHTQCKQITNQYDMDQNNNMNDHPPVRYALRDDIEGQHVQFAPLVMIIDNYDMMQPTISHRQEDRFIHDIYAPPRHSLPCHRHPTLTTRGTMQPPRAYPLIRRTLTQMDPTSSNQQTLGQPITPQTCMTILMQPAQPIQAATRSQPPEQSMTTQLPPPPPITPLPIPMITMLRMTLPPPPP